MNALRRWWRHFWLDERSLHRRLDAAALDRLEKHVGVAERGHSGQIRLCVEAALPWRLVWQKASVRSRAVALFADLRVWDTEHNNGVLIYLLIAEHAIEIVADRGLARLMSDAQWAAVMAPLQEALRAHEFERGLGHAVDAVAAVLRREFPVAADRAHADELPNRPHVL